MSDTNTVVSFTPGVKSSLVIVNTTVTCYLRDYTTKDDFTVVEEKSWDFSEASEKVTEYLLGYGVTQKLNDAAAMSKKDNPTPKKKHDKRIEMMELLIKGEVKKPSTTEPKIKISSIVAKLMEKGKTREEAEAIASLLG